MQNLVLSINNNKVKLSTIQKGEFLSTTFDAAFDVVNDTKILDVNALSIQILDALGTITQLSKSKMDLTFVLEPEDSILRFITINKNDGDINDQMARDVSTKLPGVDLADLYYSYEKIAPFLYQFSGVSKNFLDKLIQLSMAMGMSLKAVVPWVLYVPTYLNIADPAIVVANVGKSQIIALTELKGVFYTGVSDALRSMDDLQKIIHELSFYKRSQPIKKIYSLACDLGALTEGFDVSPITFDSSTPQAVQGYEANVLVHYLLDSEDYIPTQLNFLNFLPLPVVQNKQTSLVYVGAGVGSFAMVSLLLGGFIWLRTSFTGVPGVTNSEVLSNQTTAQTSQTTPTNANGPATNPVAVVTDLKRTDLKVRIENGAGVTGLAARSKEFLAKSGYTVHSIDTADKLTEPTVLNFKPSKIAFKDLVLEDLKRDVTNIRVESTLPENSAYDLLLVAGSGAKF